MVPIAGGHAGRTCYAKQEPSSREPLASLHIDDRYDETENAERRVDNRVDPLSC